MSVSTCYLSLGLRGTGGSFLTGAGAAVADTAAPLAESHPGMLVMTMGFWTTLGITDAQPDCVVKGTLLCRGGAPTP